jgi:hypothetical protein
MKWMKAGVMKDGELHEVTAGTPQGGIISPLLANVYLHYVFDLWVQSWRQKQARGDVYVVRYADDFVMGFQLEEDARAMRLALAERMAKFALELHPDKDTGPRARKVRPEGTRAEGAAQARDVHVPRLRAHRRHEPQRHLPAPAPDLGKEAAGEPRPHQGSLPSAAAPARSGSTCLAAPRRDRACQLLRCTQQLPCSGDLPLGSVPDLASLAPATESARTVARGTAGPLPRTLLSPGSPHRPSLAQREVLSTSDPRWEPGAGNPLAGFCPGGEVKASPLPERQSEDHAKPMNHDSTEP